MMENEQILERKRTLIRDLVSKIDHEAQFTNSLINEILGNMVDPVDDFIHRVEAVIKEIKSGQQKMNLVDLEILCLELPIIMYQLNDWSEFIAGKVAVAGSYRKEAYDKEFASKSGTVEDKKNFATLRVANEIMAEKILERARVKLKSKLERAQEVFSALKKLLDSRMVDKEILRRDFFAEHGLDRRNQNERDS